MLTERALARTGIDAVALKPTAVALSRAPGLSVRVTTPVGERATVENRVERLHEAGADTVVADPVCGLDALGR